MVMYILIGNIITNMNKINNISGKDILVQTPNMLLKNKVGNCHDASVYIDQICTNNNINHKCIYIGPVGKYNNISHSFIIVQTLNNKWQVIDIFSNKSGLWKIPFDYYYQAIDSRINSFIRNENNNNFDISVFIGNKLPNSGCDLLTFTTNIVNTFHLYYTKSQQQTIYEYDSKMLNEYYQIGNIESWKKHNNANCVITEENVIINEANYFDEVPQLLEDYLNEYIDKQIEQKNYFIQIPISKIADILLKTKKGNYKQFSQFLQKLKTNINGYIDFRFTPNNQCYFTPPIEISKIQIKDNNDTISFENNMTLIIHDYKKFIEAKLSNDASMNELYKVINNQIEYRDNCGEIGIGSNYFKNDKPYLSGVLNHEFGHLITFLIRVSETNHDLCRYWSKNHHDEFILNNNSLFGNNYAAYLLDSDEFKQWCTTIIQRICKVFELNSMDFSKENILDYYKYIIEHEIKHNRKYLANNEQNEEIFKNLYSYNDCLKFMRLIYQDSLKSVSIKENRNNNFTIFKKWLLHSLLKLSKDDE